MQFGKFNCAAQYNEAFCDNHGILEKPTYILFDEYHTTGHRYNPPYVPTEKQMKLWIVDMLYTYARRTHVCVTQLACVERLHRLTSSMTALAAGCTCWFLLFDCCSQIQRYPVV